MSLVVGGIVVLAVGALLVLFGIFFSLAEYRANKELGPTKFLEALTELVRAIAGRPRSVVCFTFGTLLIFLGGVIAGAAGLVA